MAESRTGGVPPRSFSGWPVFLWRRRLACPAFSLAALVARSLPSGVVLWGATLPSLLAATLPSLLAAVSALAAFPTLAALPALHTFPPLSTIPALASSATLVTAFPALTSAIAPLSSVTSLTTITPLTAPVAPTLCAMFVTMTFFPVGFFEGLEADLADQVDKAAFFRFLGFAGIDLDGFEGVRHLVLQVHLPDLPYAFDGERVLFIAVREDIPHKALENVFLDQVGGSHCYL